MLQWLTSFLTGTILAVQAISGCCWQSSCADREAAAGLASEPTSHCSNATKSCGCHQREKAPARAPVSPCKSHCRGVCQYVLPQKTLTETPQLATSFDLLPITGLLLDGHHRDVVRFSYRSRGPWESELPLRLHLLHQIQLI